jgi:hypothetical protein
VVRIAAPPRPPTGTSPPRVRRSGDPAPAREAPAFPRARRDGGGTRRASCDSTPRPAHKPSGTRCGGSAGCAAPCSPEPCSEIRPARSPHSPRTAPPPRAPRAPPAPRRAPPPPRGAQKATCCGSTSSSSRRSVPCSAISSFSQARALPPRSNTSAWSSVMRPARNASATAGAPCSARARRASRSFFFEGRVFQRSRGHRSARSPDSLSSSGLCPRLEPPGLEFLRIGSLQRSRRGRPRPLHEAARITARPLHSPETTM